MIWALNAFHIADVAFEKITTVLKAKILVCLFLCHEQKIESSIAHQQQKKILLFTLCSTTKLHELIKKV